MTRENPFDVVTPEDLSAEQFSAFYVDLYNDVPIIKQKNNTIISGARGCGKSMLIRSFLPEYLMKDGTVFSDMKFWGVNVSVFKTTLPMTELQAIGGHAPHLLNESLMIMHVLDFLLDGLSKVKGLQFVQSEYKFFYENVYTDLLDNCGYVNENEQNPDFDTAHAFFLSLKKHIKKQREKFIDYLIRVNLNVGAVDYSFNLPLFSYLRFFVPFMDALKELVGFPQDRPIFLFIDDADNLTVTQTQVLNMWISYRTQPRICIKVVTLIDSYKLYRTPWERLIESPHDYQSVNISELYTSGAGSYREKSSYRKKAIDVLKKRLKYSEILLKPNDFLPTDPKQDEKIKIEQDKIRLNYNESGRGYRVSDDVRRYAISNYMRSLGDSAKNRNTFLYAGLDGIIHMSSGIIRNYLQALATMFSKASFYEKDVVCIPPSIQNETMREIADTVLYKDLRRVDSLSSEPQPIVSPHTDVEVLQNLICAMGQTFFEILVSERSQRMVFSIALSNQPDSEISRILRLGVKLGLMHESRIGNKLGTGKTSLYILNRVIAPIFNLIPYGFQGYLYVTNEALKNAFSSGKALKAIDEKKEIDVFQLAIDDFWEE